MKSKRYFKFLSLSAVLLLLVFGAAVFLFIHLVEEIIFEKEVNLDYRILAFISTTIVSQRLTAVMSGITYFASATFLQVAYILICIFYTLKKHYRTVFEVLVIGIGGFLIAYIMKLSFHRLRPANPLIAPLQNFSFPSGHATSGFIFYGLLSYLIWNSKLPKAYRYLIGIFFILFSLIIGFSRIYLRLHFPTDVLAGFCIGFAWLILCLTLIQKLKKRELSN